MPAANNSPPPPATWIAVSSMTPCGATVAKKSYPKPALAKSAPIDPKSKPLK